MIRGGSWRHRSASLVAIATIGAALLSFGPTASAVARPGFGITGGEDGSGPAPRPTRVLPSAARQSAIRWSDLGPSDQWARAAINYVGGTHDWMRDFPANPNGSYPFKPRLIETRKYFARSIVEAFAPKQHLDSRITFSDLQPTESFYRWANIAVKMGWMRRSSSGGFMPDKPVTMTTVHRVLVLALGMRSTAKQLNALHTRDGVAFDTPTNFGTTLLGMQLGLRDSNDAEDDQDVHPSSPMPRKQVAYSIYRAKLVTASTVSYYRDMYAGIVLPKLGPARRAIVQWGIKYVGYPYIWAGEWGFDRPEPAALGGQKVAGFDCSGFSWWAMRADDGGYWNISPPRPYRGWPLPQRSSADMARFGSMKYDKLFPGDLMFYDGDSNGVVDHVDVYIGNGWALDSSHTPAGVTIMPVGSGWYRQHFVHGRRLIPSK